MASEQEPQTIEEVTDVVQSTENTMEEHEAENRELSQEALDELRIQHIMEDDGEDYSLMGSSDDLEQARSYKEYKRLQNEIQCQNSTIKDILEKIQKLESKSCLHKCDKMQLRELYDFLKQESEKLKCLTEKAMHLQNFGSHRRYGDVELVSTFDENQMPTLAMIGEQIHAPTTSRRSSKKQKRCWRAPGGDTTSELDNSCSNDDKEDLCVSNPKKLMKEIMRTLQNYTNAGSGCKKTASNSSFKSKSHTCEGNTMMTELREKLNAMQHTIDRLNEEICHREGGKGKRKPHSAHPISLPPSCGISKNQQFDDLKDKYTHLLKEFSKKEAELKDITKRIKSNCGCGGESADSAEIHLLTERINDLKEEQIEFKCLMKEQSCQLDDYRKKYLTAQQKVEEQGVLIEKLNMNNKRIEKQINLEIKEIRNKFQEKLNDLLQYPKLLENEQIKVAKLCKQKEELEHKLTIVCKELKGLKDKKPANKEGVAGDEDYKTQYHKCQKDLEEMRTNFGEMQKQRDLFCQQLKETQEDFNCLRSESAKIIARTKESSELIREKQKQHIDCLEKQLAQCRASASLSVSDRECVIREMQGQLNSLSYSFDAAQKQIKTLRNHIAYMSNENCFPAKK
ncbi:outer dense fiber protein 2 [Stomoxys calcitrans]|uniref:outer dense fiber protein 2 n=1 Tax=Stomoxys calcitrans TaxID=35570 RepID=UPI0027E24396|nr:outer dense fiber protein 2 [Stomoxys calcitrans]